MQTYKNAMVYPGPRLNLVLGPNGAQPMLSALRGSRPTPDPRSLPVLNHNYTRRQWQELNRVRSRACTLCNIQGTACLGTPATFALPVQEPVIA